LWRSLAYTSGEPVAAIATDYIEQSGIPLITVSERCDAGTLKLQLAQQRFTSHYPDAAPLRWQIPVVFGGATAGRLLLTDTETDIEAGPCAVPVKLNPNGIGYYRVAYDAGTAKTLTAAFAQLSAGDKVNLLADDWALVEAGAIPPAEYFTLVDRVRPEDGRTAWETVIRTMARLDHLERLAPQRTRLQAYGRLRLRAAFEPLDWQAKAGEAVDISLLRPTLIRNLGDFGDTDI
jgi:aminopeptidase N